MLSVGFPRHLCDTIMPRAEKRRTQGHPVPRGGFHKAGEGPAFGDSFPDFSSGRNRAQRSVPGWGAGFCLRNWRKLPIKKKVRPDFSDRTFLFYQGLSCADDAPSPQPPARRRTEPEHPAPGSAGRRPRSGARQSQASGWPRDWWRSPGRGKAPPLVGLW